MVDRIVKNENRLDDINKVINELEKSLNEFKSKKKDINLLKKYYGSKSWFKDKEDYENNKSPKIKAGVLSEDAVWNTLDDINELMKEMKSIIDNYKEV